MNPTPYTKRAARAAPLGAALALVPALLAGCGKRADGVALASAPSAISHVASPPRVEAHAATPYVPPQCYTKTAPETPGARAHNPCFTCHASAAPPSYVADEALQMAYAFGPASRVNPWTNLFVDRTAAVAAMPDDETLAYVRTANYERWKAPRDGWTGWLPDVAFRFDDEGFDRDEAGDYTGWRAYAYLPLPGGFWPTNGSFGDAMIRLPAPFREDATGRFDARVYAVNFAILESLITRRDVALDAVDEARFGVDLDGDGTLGAATKVRYRWRPNAERGGMTWVGRAKTQLNAGEVHLAAGLFPEGTEIAHSLRYLDIDAGRVTPAKRMKELRYMVKAGWVSYGRLEAQVAKEAAEKLASPHKTREVSDDGSHGIGNRAGWRLEGFIESEGGALRPQTLEEHTYCIGCHSGVGVTDDSVFSFGRQVGPTGYHGGWFHPTQRDLAGVGELVRADGRGEYADYLDRNGAGDELRANDEVKARFFDGAGNLRVDAVAQLKSDVRALLLPSPARALTLDKAYRVIVAEQSFTRGRDATVTPAQNVHRELPEAPLATGVVAPVLDRRRRAAYVARRAAE